ncbi:MAG: NUDIX domain-containing protein [Anaerolineae bacterium]
MTGRPDQQYPEPTVGALVFDPDGRLLLMRSHKWLGQYVMPGGHVELGESLEAALRREIAEETGLTIYDIAFLGMQEFIYDPAFWQPRHFLFFDYTCRTSSTDVRLNDEALRLPIEPYTMHAIRLWMAQREDV